MGIWSWALIAAAAVLFVFAIQMLFRGRRTGATSKTRPLGCGFGIVATVVWALAFSDLLGDWWTGLRLAVAIVLFLPVVDAIANPRKGRAVWAVVCVILSVVLAGPVLVSLWERIRPPTGPAAFVAEVRTNVDKLRAERDRLDALVLRLYSDRIELRASIRALGHESFDDAAGDPTALQKLEELAEVERLIAGAEERRDLIDERLPRLESSLRRLERQLEAETTSGDEVSRTEVESLFREIDEQPTSEGPATVEELQRREALRDLFESSR